MATVPCTLYTDLETRVNALRYKFVQDQVELENKNPTAFTADLDRLAAFRLLVHAEFEEYLENKAREGLDHLDKGFKDGAQAIRANLSILIIGAMLGKQAKFDSNQWKEFVGEVIKTARNAISENNGIKENSFTQLVVFSGKMPDEIDETLSSVLTSYGRSRGEVAHQSVTRVRTIRAPSAEAKEAEDILHGLKRYFE
jgi:hypothetical protein